MSRTTLCVLTAAALAAISVGVAVARLQVMGQQTRMPNGPGHYHVTLVVRGKSTGDCRLVTACPLDFNHQHIFGENPASAELYPKIVEGQGGTRRYLQWTQRVGVSKVPIQARYEFHCSVDVQRPSASMVRLSKALHAPPRGSDDLTATTGVDPGHPQITQLALELTGGLNRPADQVRALFQYVDKMVAKEPGPGRVGQTAVDCLRQGRGDALGKSRLLVALCRNRGIPARVVTGLALARRTEQRAHFWAEAWVGEYWMPLCPYHHFCGRVPPTYLVFGFGDQPMVRGRNVRDLDYSCLVGHSTPEGANAAADQASWIRKVFTALSLHSLPPAEWRLVEFLLLLPIAALIICIFRNLIGLSSFGTFAPALIGLAFRQLESLPGILVFVSIVLIGWGMRRVLDRYHLLQVPRTAFLLSLVVLVLIVSILAANYEDLAPTRYISLFPIIILTGMIERFWTLEAEDGTVSSFKTLLGTMVIAASISLFLSIPAVVRHMVNFPETLGLIMACQLLLGRYTGYRLSELFRFRDFVHERAVQ
jgi:hypothetical protein